MHDYLGPSFVFRTWVCVNRIVSCAEIQLEPPRLSRASGVAIENRPQGQGSRTLIRRAPQAARTGKWRSAHSEKNRTIRRQQYRRSRASELGLSRHAATRIAEATTIQSGSEPAGLLRWPLHKPL